MTEQSTAPVASCRLSLLAAEVRLRALEDACVSDDALDRTCTIIRGEVIKLLNEDTTDTSRCFDLVHAVGRCFDYVRTGDRVHLEMAEDFALVTDEECDEQYLQVSAGR